MYIHVCLNFVSITRISPKTLINKSKTSLHFVVAQSDVSFLDQLLPNNIALHELL